MSTKMSDSKNRSLHIAMYPWFGISHMTSNLHLANKLAKRGHKVTLFLPSNSQSKIASHNYHPTLISFVPISVPHVDGLPPGAETPNDVPRSALPFLMTAMDLTRDVVRAHLISLKPDIVLFDLAHWIPELTKELGMKSIMYNTGYLTRVAHTLSKIKNAPKGHQFMIKEADLLAWSPGFPSQAVRLEPYEARVLETVAAMDFGGLPFLERLTRAWMECDAMGSKTCKEMEGHFCQYVEEVLGKPVLLAGPVIPEPLDSTLDPFFDVWLNGFAKDSVIYCALGSECVLEIDQFQEILLGLELTGLPFLAALKPPNCYKATESALPEGFAERIKEKGIVHSGWVQQQLILKHPSVGCFITHCGSGSLSEAMVSKCQLVMIPQAGDQFINAKLMSLELRVGVQVHNRENDGFVTKEALCNVVSMVMDGDNGVGREVRENHAKWRDVLLAEGLEESYISNFIQKLYELLGLLSIPPSQLA